jgi:hypothetical protein
MSVFLLLGNFLRTHLILFHRKKSVFFGAHFKLPSFCEDEKIIVVNLYLELVKRSRYMTRRQMDSPR